MTYTYRDIHDMGSPIIWLVVSGVSRGVGDQVNGRSGVRAGRVAELGVTLPAFLWRWMSRERPSLRVDDASTAIGRKWMTHRPPWEGSG
jgi:hypothetical protein